MNRLHYFCTLAATGSLTQASELLNISQPALSKAIKTLEAELNKKLIIPEGRGIAITDYGYKLAQEAEPLLSKIDQLKNLDKVNHAPPPLSIATFEVFSTYFLNLAIHDEFPEQEIRVIERIPGAMEDAVLSSQADIGITYLPVVKSGLDIHKITTVEMGIFGNLNTLAETAPLKTPFVIPVASIPETPSRVKGLDGWPDDKIQRNIRYQVTLMETALGLCRQGLCVGYFPEFVVELHNQTVLSNLRLSKLKAPSGLKKTKQDVYIMKRKSDLESKDYKKLSRALRRLTK